MKSLRKTKIHDLWIILTKKKKKKKVTDVIDKEKDNNEF